VLPGRVAVPFSGIEHKEKHFETAVRRVTAAYEKMEI
jgi:hypothetical protein